MADRARKPEQLANVLMARGSLMHMTYPDEVERWKAFGYVVVDASSPEEKGGAADKVAPSTRKRKATKTKREEATHDESGDDTDSDPVR